MGDNHTELCERLIAEIGKAILGEGEESVAVVLSRCAALIKSQAARIQQQALEYLSLFDQCNQHLARIAELEKERDALKADAIERCATSVKALHTRISDPSIIGDDRSEGAHNALYAAEIAIRAILKEKGM